MKNIVAYTLHLILVCCCFSCNQEKPHVYEELSNLNFGTGSYPQEPIKGISKYVPFSWFGPSDPVKVNSEFEIEFNEDAIRSHSAGEILFIDENGSRINTIAFGNPPSPSFNIQAKEGRQIIPIELTVNPLVGDTILAGSIVMVSNGIDKVNHTELSSNATSIGTWSMHHKLGINWIQCILLVLLCIILIVIVWFLLKGLFVAITYIISDIASTAATTTSSIFNKKQERQKDFSNRTKKKKRNPFIERCEKILLSQASVSDKAVTLERLFNYWDYDLPEEEKDFEGSILNPKVMMAMDELWGKYYKYTKKNMMWDGEPFNSRLIPDKNIIPPNRNYSNVDTLTWGQIMNKHNYCGLLYHRGKPDFAEYAKYTIVIPNFDQYINPYKDDERGPLQDKAFEILAKQFPGYDIASMKKIKENNRLVWHEDTDCKTMYLVPQEIHNNLHHFGGIGMLRVLRSSGLV